MKSALVTAVMVLSASLGLSAVPSSFQITPPSPDVSVTKFERGGGGGGGGGGSGHGGSSGGGGRGAVSGGGARGFSGARGYAGGYRGGYRFSGQRGTMGRYGGVAIRPTGAQRQFATHANRTGTTANRAHRSVTNNRAGANKRSLANNRNRAGKLGKKENATFARQSLTTRDGKAHKGNWARNNAANKTRFGRETQDRLRNFKGHRSDVNEARQRHHDHCHGHHNHDWWNHHCDTIIFWGSGWWGWWDGWWYPAWGYDYYYNNYPYDAPIYGYDGLPPDEVVANVQSELQRRGYYHFEIDGVAGAQTEAALNRYQRDHRLPITGTIDQPTLGSLGLTQ